MLHLFSMGGLEVIHHHNGFHFRLEVLVGPALDEGHRAWYCLLEALIGFLHVSIEQYDVCESPSHRFFCGSYQPRHQSALATPNRADTRRPLQSRVRKNAQRLSLE